MLSKLRRCEKEVVAACGRRAGERVRVCEREREGPEIDTTMGHADDIHSFPLTSRNVLWFGDAGEASASEGRGMESGRPHIRFVRPYQQ